MQKLIQSTMFGLALSAAGTFAMVACSDDAGQGAHAAPSAEETGDVGALSLAMTAVGPDGATYWLTPGTQVEIWPSADGGTPITSFAVQPTLVTDTLSLPTGTYGVSLIWPTWPPPDDAGTPWTLVRKDAAGQTNVSAYLVDTGLLPAKIVQGQTTPVAFHFILPNLGPLTFSTGTVTATMGVDASAAPAASAQYAGLLSLYDYVFGGPPIDPLFATINGEQVNLAVQFTLTGPFVAQVGTTCAPGRITSLVATAIGDAGIAGPSTAALGTENIGDTGQFCVQLNGTTNNIMISAGRSGAATTPTFQNAIGDAGAWYFQFTTGGQPATNVYDGTTLSLAAMAKPVALTNGMTTFSAGPLIKFNNVNMTVQVLP